MPDIKDLQLMANKLRIHSIESTSIAGSGHPTSCMSCAEIMSCLFFSEMKADDEFILSKGHAAPILWACYAEAGIIPVSRLKTLRRIDSNLEGHPTKNMKMIKVATGSLGQGLAAGLGMALAKRVRRKKGRVYVLMGDGEIAEGSVWESANAAAIYRVNTLVAIVDVNRLGQSQQTMHGHHLNRYKAKWEAFGWSTAVIDGHDVNDVLKALKRAGKRGKPLVILAKTKKGKGFSEVEDRNGWHGKPFKKDMMERAIKEIQSRGDTSIKLRSSIRYRKIRYNTRSFRPNNYRKGDMVATRSAFGNALVRLGDSNKDVVACDGDVKNSTMTEAFFRRFPKRSFESFIAEQNMIGMAVGLSAEGLVPFASTFAAFLTRAHDFIRMAIYSGSDIKIAGSHAGISIGEDGASQMGLEDISMFLSMPDSLIQYPCDAVSAERCVQNMAKHKGISYLRTTRAKTPVIYSNDEKFPVGGLKVVRKNSRDSVLVIGAGITLYGALKAYDKLDSMKVKIRVIDLYSIRPVDAKALRKNAMECRNRVVVVEDHYYGGIGCVVKDALGSTCDIEHLYVKDIPRSGKPEQLLRKYNIDSNAIIRSVKKLRRKS